MANPVVKLLQQRHATRAIQTTPLSDDAIRELCEAVRLTPSCFNKQPWHYLFLTSEQARKQGAEALAPGNRAWATRAPLLIVGYSRKTDDCLLDDGRAYHQFDLGMSTMNLMLAATHHDLVARPMAGFDPAKVAELFGLDAAAEPMIMIAVGPKSSDDSHLPDHYKKVAQQPRTRKAVEEIVETL